MKKITKILLLSAAMVCGCAGQMWGAKTTTYNGCSYAWPNVSSTANPGALSTGNIPCGVYVSYKGNTPKSTENYIQYDTSSGEQKTGTWFGLGDYDCTCYFSAGCNAGYYFIGWYTDNAYTKSKTTANPYSTTNSNLTLYAKFAPCNVTSATTATHTTTHLATVSGSVTFSVKGYATVGCPSSSNANTTNDFTCSASITTGTGSISVTSWSRSGDVVTVNYSLTPSSYGTVVGSITLTSKGTDTGTSSGTHPAKTATVTVTSVQTTVDGVATNEGVTATKLDQDYSGFVVFNVSNASGTSDFSIPAVQKTSGDGTISYSKVEYSNNQIKVYYTYNANGAEGQTSGTATLTSVDGSTKTATILCSASEDVDWQAEVWENGSRTKTGTWTECLTYANTCSTNPTIKLRSDTSGLTDKQTISKSMTLDLNDKTLSGALTSQAGLIDINGSGIAVKITDSGAGNGKISNVSAAAVNLHAAYLTNGSLTIEGGTIHAENTSTTTGSSYRAIGVETEAGTTLKVTGGTIEGVCTKDYSYGIWSSGTTNITGGTIRSTADSNSRGLLVNTGITTMTGGTITASSTTKDAVGVYMNNASGVFNQNGGSILANTTTNSAKGFYWGAAGATIKVSAGTVSAAATGTDAYGILDDKGGKITITGGTISGTTNSTTAAGMKIAAAGTYSITGGSFLGQSDYAPSGETTTNAYGLWIANASAVVKPENATFVGKLTKNYADKAYGINSAGLLTAKNCTIQAEGKYHYTYGVYTTNNASIEGCTVIVNSAYAYNYGLMIDAAGKTLTASNNTVTCTGGTTYVYGLDVNNGIANVTGSTFNVSGMSSSTSAAESYLYGAWVNTGKELHLTNCQMDVQGSAVYSKNAYGLYNAGTTTVDGTTISVSSVNTGAYALRGTTAETSLTVNSGHFKVSTTGTGAPVYPDASCAGKTVIYHGYFNNKTNLETFKASDATVFNLTSGTDYNAGYTYEVAQGTPSDVYVCKIGSTNYNMLETALAYANNNSSTAMTIIMTNNYRLPSGTYSLPTSATLLVPRNAAQTSAIGTTANRVTAKEELSQYVCLTLGDGVTLNVDGVIEVSCQENIGGQGVSGNYGGGVGVPSGSFGRIHMESGSVINMKSDSRLQAWGFITGDGKIVAKSGSKVYEMFQILDWKGGSASSNMIDNDNKILPICQYAVQNVEAPLEFQYGSQELISTGTHMATTVLGTDVQKDATVDGMVYIGSTSGLFRLGSGATVEKKYDPVKDQQIYTVNGTASMNDFEMNLSIDFTIKTYNIDIKTQNYRLPMTNNYVVNIESGTTTLNNARFELTPGSEVNIYPGATVSVPNELTLYDASEWGSNYAYSNAATHQIPYSPTKTGKHGIKDAQLCVNGTLNVGGKLYTTSGGAAIISTNENPGTINFTSAPPTDNITVYQYTTADASATSGQTANPARLLNGDGKYYATSGLGAKTVTYKNSQWGWLHYTVQYNANGGSGTIADQNFLDDNAQNLTENAFTNSNKYTVTYNYNGNGQSSSTGESTLSFGGWATTANGAAVYADKQSVSGLSSTDGATVPLYAHWNGSAQTLPAPNARAGYDFAGWYTEAGTSVGAAGASYSPTGNITLYAHWTPRSDTKYTEVIQVMGTDGKYTTETTTQKQGTTDTEVTDSRTERTGFTKVAVESTPTINGDGSTVVTYQYSRNKYDIQWVVDGSTLEGTTFTNGKTFYEATITQPTQPTKTGYQFTGWEVSHPASSAPARATVKKAVAEEVPATVPAENTTFTAQWSANTYTVQFLAGEGSGDAMSNQSFTYDETAKALSANSYTGPSCMVTFDAQGGPSVTSLSATRKFSNWKDADGKTYTDQQAVSNLTTEQNGTVTLTAQWGNGTITLPKPATYTGRTFTGWYDAAGNKAGDAGDSYATASDVTLLAHWTAVEVTVYETNGTSSTKTATEFNNIRQTIDQNAIAVAETQDAYDALVDKTNVLLETATDGYICSSLVLADKQTFVLPVRTAQAPARGMAAGSTNPSVFADAVTYTRKLYAGYNTMTLPFKLTTAMLPDGAKIYTVSSGTNLSQNAIGIVAADEVEAGTPCLVHVDADVTSWTPTVADATVTDAISTETGMVGFYTKHVLPTDGTEENYYAPTGSGNALSRIVPGKSNGYVNAFRAAVYAVVEADGAAPRLVIMEASQIENPTSLNDASTGSVAEKFFKDNKLFIRKNGRIYNASGTLVK